MILDAREWESSAAVERTSRRSVDSVGGTEGERMDRLAVVELRMRGEEGVSE
jgi:hypothetical protein